MTDQDLLAALAEKTPDELSEAEIDYLRRRLAESAELREALLGQVQMEAYLAAALGRVNFSTEDILKRADQHRRPQSGAAAVYLGIPLVLLALVGMLFLFREAIWGRQGPEIADAPSKLVDSTKDDEANRDDKAAGNQDGAPAVIEDKAAPVQSDAATKSKAASDPDSPGKDNVATPAPPSAAAPTSPWQPVLAQEENLPAFEEVAFRPFDLARQLPRRTDLLAWFEAVPGHNHRMTEVDTPRGKCGQLEGLARLKSP
ncbi:MAG: hypothetical protein WEH44_03445, partial [Pirellulaceae bacterium]